MTKAISRNILLTLIVILLTASFPGSAWAIGYVEKQITNDPSHQFKPSISGSKIVWQDGRNGNYDIYMYDYLTGEEKQITSNPADQTNPIIDGSKISWRDQRNGNEDVYIYDLNTGKETIIAQTSRHESPTSISGDWVMWSISLGWGTIENHILNLTTGTKQVLYWGLGGGAINNDQLVWSDDNTFYYSNIWYKNLITGEKIKITNNDSISQSHLANLYPSIYGNNIVWSQHFVHPLRGEPSVFLYDLITKETKVIGKGERPRISGDNVVYQNAQGIALYKISSGETIQVANGSNPVIDGDVVVWSQNKYGSNDVFMAMPGALDTVPTSTIIDIKGVIGVNEWYTSDVQVTLSATDTDGGSGVAKTEYSFDGNNWVTYTVPFNVTVEGITKVYYRSMDIAGNLETTKEAQIKIDKTAPIIEGSPTTVSNASGWYNTDVVVHFTADDNVSGLNSVTPDQTMYNEGTSLSVTGTATDRAGNSTSVTVTGINIDKTAPDIVINSPVEGKEYILNEKVVADWTAVDVLSGLGSSEGTIPSLQTIDTSTVGTKTLKIVATDKAGNEITKIVTYHVIYAFNNLLTPIKEGKIYKSGSTIPVKFQLKDVNGKFISMAQAKLYLTNVSNGVSDTEIEAVSTSSAVNGNIFRYDSTSDQYIFNLETKGLLPGSWQLKIQLDDGTSQYVILTLK